ncbi:MAG: type II toxin-antitoxin system VapC family toxin [Candidatus Brockarchaeota archaeon]|nr:type II toxin-antitoxin system VapC family toxin [Candidatus Brockarchaeota archaeon]MBO3809777.1 type II toxin-antitoxin system VapC family toxin [Candidatus Brockarchaeota archaeon]
MIALIRRNPRAERKLEEYVSSGTRLSTTPITACELFKGAYRSKRRDVEVRKVREILTLLEMFDFSIDSCEKYGKLVNDLERAGTPIGDLDAIIASLALTHNEPVVTADKEHFERVSGLIVESW